VTDEHQMSRAIHELRARGKRLLKPLEFIWEGATAWRTHGVPSGVRYKPTVKQVKPTQILDVEMAGEMVSQFDRRKQVKAER
jgi:hypothetical protein